MCIIALGSRVLSDPARIGPQPTPNSFSGFSFFDSPAGNVSRCGSRRQTAAWDNGIMLNVSDDNAVPCFLLDLLDCQESLLSGDKNQS
ncbi:hypothetical protein R3P38DRAFT_72559 [Favolaschia claudopus]|uniref:Uncharacterized protein n=1 Tax=Favolaschia claudopus TaxID=2862362 RepID=A0AAW0D613_9AGAR